MFGPRPTFAVVTYSKDNNGITRSHFQPRASDFIPLGALRRKDYYDVLQLPKGASDSQLKRSYRKLALQYHPVRPLEVLSRIVEKAKSLA